MPFLHSNHSLVIQAAQRVRSPEVECHAVFLDIMAMPGNEVLTEPDGELLWWHLTCCTMLTSILVERLDTMLWGQGRVVMRYAWHIPPTLVHVLTLRSGRCDQGQVRRHLGKCSATTTNIAILTVARMNG